MPTHYHPQRRNAREQGDAEKNQGERLQKYLARARIASRRRAEELILAGAITVNGEIVRELGTRVNPGTDEVRVNGRLARPTETAITIMLNKPLNTVTTAHDPEGRRTVLDLLPAQWVAERVYPVGRLDRDTEGVLLLTNDGDLALRLTHPRYELTKEYEALVEGRPSVQALRRLERGVMLEGDTRPTAPARAWIIEPAGELTWVGLELHEGRNRQARRMFDAVGHPVRRLIRTRVGPLMLDGLAPGASRLLTEEEIAKLQAGEAAQ